MDVKSTSTAFTCRRALPAGGGKALAGGRWSRVGIASPKAIIWSPPADDHKVLTCRSQDMSMTHLFDMESGGSSHKGRSDLDRGTLPRTNMVTWSSPPVCSGIHGLPNSGAILHWYCRGSGSVHPGVEEHPLPHTSSKRRLDSATRLYHPAATMELQRSPPNEGSIARSRMAPAVSTAKGFGISGTPKASCVSATPIHPGMAERPSPNISNMLRGFPNARTGVASGPNPNNHDYDGKTSHKRVRGFAPPHAAEAPRSSTSAPWCWCSRRRSTSARATRRR